MQRELFWVHFGTGWSGEADSGSHRVPPRLCQGQHGPTSLQGETFKRATDGASQPGSGPLQQPFLELSPKGQGE